MLEVNNPRLFGINRSNRDYTKPETWGKNQFNSSFPASLACYLFSKKLKAVYIRANRNMGRDISSISIDKLFGINPLSEEVFYSFETQFTPYSKYVIGSIPRNDLVIQNLSTNECVSSLEIKLTALPDNSTCNLTEGEFGSEIVVRPDTIVYLACSFINMFDDNRDALINIIGDSCGGIKDWTQASEVLPFIPEMLEVIYTIVSEKNDYQVPIIMEPIWKTNGKSPQLADNCLDVFVWSNFGVLKLFLPSKDENLTSINRHTRSMVWLFKMLFDFAKKGHFDGASIIDELSYNTKNDKAFATNGCRTHSIMACPELTCPRIKKDEIKKIILGGGQNLLSPERRFDAIIYNSPDLFDADVSQKE